VLNLRVVVEEGVHTYLLALYPRRTVFYQNTRRNSGSRNAVTALVARALSMGAAAATAALTHAQMQVAMPRSPSLAKKAQQMPCLLRQR
jgi:hypothetical protein